MDRRRFLASSLLGGLGVATTGTDAKALQMVECGPDSAEDGCRRIAEHDDLLQSIDAMLVKKGLSAFERRAVLATASCPFCGLPLMGAGQGVF
jgi:hypothetical protein